MTLRVGLLLCLGMFGLLFLSVEGCDSEVTWRKAPILALYEQDGAVFADVAACERDGARAFSVFPLDEEDDWWQIRRGVDGPRPTEIRLFEAPAGWRLEGRGSLLRHPAFVPGSTYHVYAETDLLDFDVFDFEPSQLEGTSRDRVLTSIGRYRDSGKAKSATMSRDAFDERVGRYCAKHHHS